MKKKTEKNAAAAGDDLKRGPNLAVQWSPRALAIIFILFIMYFSLDVVNEKMDFWETAPNFLMHNIPAFILLAALIISWKYELVGAVVYILAGILYVIWVVNTPRLGRLFLTCMLTVAAPAFLIGILFLVNWTLKRHKKK